MASQFSGDLSVIAGSHLVKQKEGVSKSKSLNGKKKVDRKRSSPGDSGRAFGSCQP